MNLRNLARRVRSHWMRRSPRRVATAAPECDYADRVRSEQAFFSGDQEQHDLSEIYHYWSHKFLRPKLERLGIPHPVGLFCQAFERSYRESTAASRRFVSIGAGGCATEVEMARFLVGRGLGEFVIECVELNPALLAGGTTLAQASGVGDHILPVQADANKWVPAATYDGVLANSSLHHIVNLEGLFEGIESSLAPTGTFVTSDTVGRNGHMRWPEALAIVEEFWRELPKEYTYNRLLRRYEQVYDNWDCSISGFEGIRAQDILPLLIKHFDFDVFVPFANVVDPFIDRAFGPNFRIARPWDTAFIDRVQARDEAEIARGAITPTHIVAAMCVGRPGRGAVADGLTPRFCVRSPARSPRPYAKPPSPKDEAPAASTPDRASAEGNAPVHLSILPDNPRRFEPLVARIALADGAPWRLELVSVRRDGNGIRIELRRVVQTSGDRPGSSVDVSLGNFASGPVSVAVVEGSNMILKEAAVEVVDSAHMVGPSHPWVDYSDLWWNPAEPGWGLSIHQHASDRIVATFLAYDASGHPVWFNLQPGIWTGSARYEGPIYRYIGTNFAAAFVPGTVRGEQAGTGALVFADASNGTFCYEIDGIRAERDIRRMEF